MKTIIYSQQPDVWFFEHGLSFRERNRFEEEIHSSFEILSRKRKSQIEQMAFKIDFLQPVFEMEIGSTTILVIRIRSADERG